MSEKTQNSRKRKRQSLRNANPDTAHGAGDSIDKVEARKQAKKKKKELLFPDPSRPPKPKSEEVRLWCGHVLSAHSENVLIFAF